MDHLSILLIYFLILKHVEEDPTELKYFLSREKYRKVIRLYQLSPKTIQDLKINQFEKNGWIILLLNGVITGIFGAWLGIISFIGLELDSLNTFYFLIFLSIFICILVSYFANQYQKKFSSETISKIKCNLAKLKVYRLLNISLNKKAKMAKIRMIDGKNLIFLKELAKHNSPKSKRQKAGQWLNGNLANQLTNLLPTIFGTFGSMFVFLSGGKNLADKLNLTQLYRYMDSSYGHIIGLIIASLLTLYFAYANFKHDYMNYKRQHEINQLEERIKLKQQVCFYYLSKIILAS